VLEFGEVGNRLATWLPMAVFGSWLLPMLVERGPDRASGGVVLSAKGFL